MSALREQLTASIRATEPRDLKRVLGEIGVAERRCRLWRFSDREGVILDRLEDLRAEARAMVEDMTGVEWETLAGANL